MSIKSFFLKRASSSTVKNAKLNFYEKGHPINQNNGALNRIIQPNQQIQHSTNIPVPIAAVKDPNLRSFDEIRILLHLKFKYFFWRLC